MSPEIASAVRAGALEQLKSVVRGDLGVVASGNGRFQGVFIRDASYAYDHFASCRMSDPEAALFREGIQKTLTTCARYQGNRFDERTLEEPGRIPHEIHAESSDHQHLEKVLINKGPVYMENGNLKMITYWGLDSTCRWISTYVRHVLSTGDIELRDKLFNAFEKGLEWLNAKESPSGLIYGGSERPGVAKNPCWKDSDNAFILEDGDYPEYPIAPLDVNAFNYVAHLEAARLYESIGELDKAQTQFERALLLRTEINKSYWISDIGIYSPALDKWGRPIPIITTDVVIALWAGVLDEGRHKDVVDRMMKPDLLTRFGLRTRSRLSRQYSSLDYQNGNVWFHLAPIAADACEKLGMFDEARVFDSCIEPTVEQNFCELAVVDDLGNISDYEERGVAVACRLQTWVVLGVLNRATAVESRLVAV